ncbi:hypothetical protein TNCV_1103191 [Trichonephila clavipes]|nr:hypothetical protein TNCV_1103191 [Trichonephila clavipes]
MFRAQLEENESDYGKWLYHADVRWLCRSIFLQRFRDLLQEPILQILDGAPAACQDPDTVLIRVESMIKSASNSNEFRSKDGTVFRIPDADLSITPGSVTKCTTSLLYPYPKGC